jgi:hypothetical protein
VGLLSILTGRSRMATPAPERLFAITTAYITLEASYSIAPTGAAAIVFQPLATAEFESTMRDMEEVVRATGQESGTQVRSENDSYGYRWMIVRNAPGNVSVEDLAVAINAVSSAIEASGHSERLLCAVFAFHEAQNGRPERPIYLIYNYKRGFWYPFVPAAGSEQRSTERELQLKAQIGQELPLEPELERWFPLWGIPI